MKKTKYSKEQNVKLKTLNSFVHQINNISLTKLKRESEKSRFQNLKPIILKSLTALIQQVDQSKNFEELDRLEISRKLAIFRNQILSACRVDIKI